MSHAHSHGHGHHEGDEEEGGDHGHSHGHGHGGVHGGGSCQHEDDHHHDHGHGHGHGDNKRLRRVRSDEPLLEHGDDGHGHGHGGHGHGHGGHGHGHGGHKSHAKKASDMKLRVILVIMVLSTLYSCIEIGFALHFSSLVMFSDGVHNLSDGLALVIAYWAEHMKLKEGTGSLTYGWRRTEILGGLFNGLFLLSMGIFVFLQAIPLFINPSDSGTDSSISFAYIAGAGIALNLTGTLAFMTYGGGHGHSHGGGDHGHGGKKKKEKSKKVKGGNGNVLQYSSINSTVQADEDHHDDHHEDHHAAHTDHNMWALFIHFLGDVLTSMIVLTIGLLAHYYPPSEHSWVNYLEPSGSMLSVLIIVGTAWPVVKSCSWILLQSSPDSIDMDQLVLDVQNIAHIESIHELHVWKLVDAVTIGSLHVVVRQSAPWSKVVDNIKQVLHRYGIHSSTIQPEFIPDDDHASGGGSSVCVLPGGACVEACVEETCCSTKEEQQLRKRSIQNV